MSFVNTNLFKTELMIPLDTPIISLSDIHGDIDALIIALRDCAKVIKSKNMLLPTLWKLSVREESPLQPL